MDFNLTQQIFIVAGGGLSLMGLLVQLAEPYLPAVLRNAVRYGRYAAKGKSLLDPVIYVPKRWFKHFYAFAAPTATCVLFITLRVYLGAGTVPNYLYQILDILFGEDRKPLVSPEHTTLALVLLTIQCWKRFYESHYVSIFSDAKMNLGHYSLGFLHYSLVTMCMIGESEGFIKGSEPVLNWNKLTYFDYAFAIIFLWSTYKQFNSNVILANLRKNKKGNVVTLEHKVPKGDLFDYISSPLQFTEIMIYFMLTLILWSSETYHYACAWVFANQMMTGLYGHWWYVETFKDYPKQRKAVIPWVL